MMTSHREIEQAREQRARALERGFSNSVLAIAGLLAVPCLQACTPGKLDWASARGDASVQSARDAEVALVSPDASSSASTVDEIRADSLSNENVIGLLEGWKYRGAGFRKVNEQPFPSTVSPDKTVTLWISEAGYDEFTRVSPDHSGSQAAVPVGTVIAREVLSGGALDTITIMARLPDGSFPLGGDWWYAAATPDGKIKLDPETGAPLAGMLANCGTCHLRRSADDHLFGAPDGYLP